MKRVLVMRHAKSSWKQPTLSDHQRPLNGRGQKDAPKVARALVARGWAPDRVLCSDASRTHETWVYMSDVFRQPASLSLESSLYLAGIGDFRKVLGRCDEQFRSVLLLGHNPGWEDIVSHFSGQTVTMPTGAVALFEVEQSVPWSEVCGLSRWEMRDLILPRAL